MEKKKFDFPSGELILVNKPVRWTSFDIVGKIRSLTSDKGLKVGHAGTLDPLADGLLIVCTGKMTKQIDVFQSLPKEYTGTMRFGATRPSYDMETEIDTIFEFDHITLDLIRDRIKSFIGTIWQVSPSYSARRTQGVRAYEKARMGEIVEIAPREVQIEAFDILDFQSPALHFRIRCSKGTYIRSLVRDLGLALGSGAYLSQLTRTSIGEYTLKNAWDLGALCEEIQSQKVSMAKKPQVKLEENKKIRLFTHDPE